jgi:hypothetical protein
MSDAFPGGLFCLIFFGVVALIAVFAIFAYLQAEKRRKELAGWAQSHGLRFSADRDSRMDDRYPDFGCLRQGEARYAYNITNGNWKARGLTAFDYHYETHSTNSEGQRQTHHNYFSAVILDTEYRLRPLTVRAETFVDKIAGFVGFEDINFESAEFSREFYVKSPDRKWAYDMIQQSTMEFLLQSPRFAIEMHGRSVIASRGDTFSPATFEAAIAVIEGILERLPPGLQKELRAE